MTVPLYEIAQSGLVGFRLLKGGADLYEEEIERLLWENFDDFTGESFFRIKRQAHIKGGGIPDIIALDDSARVVVIEVKRDVDRNQLAQCLEYAGWAKHTSLDELAGLYHGGPGEFFGDWQEFTDSDAPVVINPNPRLILVARDFDDRTFAAFEFLSQGKLPVHLIRVSIYEDASGRRFVDIEGEHEPVLDEDTANSDIDHTKIAGRRLRLADLTDAGLLLPGDRLIWNRPQLGITYRAIVTEDAAIHLEDGGTWTSPSRAAVEAAGIPSYDGWYAWRVERVGKTLDELRRDLSASSPSEPG